MNALKLIAALFCLMSACFGATTPDLGVHHYLFGNGTFAGCGYYAHYGSSPSYVYCGVPSSLWGTIKNYGDGEVAGPIEVKIIVGGEEYIVYTEGIRGSGTNFYLDEFVVEAGKDCQQSANCDTPQYVNVEVIVDPENKIDEINEDNNRCQQRLELTCLSEKARIIPVPEFSQQTQYAGKPFTLRYVISNVGKESIDSGFKAELIISKIYPYAGDSSTEEYMAEEQIPALGPAESYVFYGKNIVLEEGNYYTYMRITGAGNTVWWYENLDRDNDVALVWTGQLYLQNSSEGDNSVKLRIYQEYEKKERIHGSGIIEDVLVFKKEWLGYEGTLAEKITMNAVYPEEVGETVTYNLYLGDEYLNSCEMPYGDGEECYISIDLPSGSTLEGKTYQISSGYGIEDFNIYILEPGESVPLVTVKENMTNTNETVLLDLCKNVSCKDYCSGKTLYSSGKCNENTGKCEYSSKQCENGCDPGSAKCIQQFGNVRFDVFIQDYEQGVVGSGQDSVKVTARLMEEGIDSIEPIEGADVAFEVTAPAGSGAFKKYGGKMTIEGTTNSNGEANANIEVPALTEFYPGSREDTYVTLIVKASKHSDGMDFDYEDGPYTIEVLSPAISIEKISISPNPAKAYEMHDILIKTSDAYAGGPTQYTVSVTQGTLSYGKTVGEPGGGIAFDSYGNEVHVNWEAPERGLTPYEFDYAKEVRDANKGLGISAGSSVVGIAFPIVKSGETIYGMYGDAKNVVGEIGQLDESLSAEEGAWRILDATVSDVKLMVGAINLVVGASPGVGSAAVGLGEDTLIYGVERGQAVIKENVAEARWEQMETRKIDQMIRVDVVDSEGYSDTDFLIYQMEYLWEKGVAE